MIGYLDTSALVPLLVAESSSRACRRFWDDADAVVSCRLLFVEAAAALAQARRMERIGVRAHTSSLRRLDDLWEQMDIIEVDDALVRGAATLAHRFGLRGYDAVHCASAQSLDEPVLVAAAGDQRLLDAWQRLGISTFDTNGS
ncbi:MAG TPA: type II toxin-antitoxin system VapC family toxin [Micromonosporaceae bacterium]|nr:type II toxin-antitoxin system VapC family toxin [Micromonosporaceae bacterium]